MNDPEDIIGERYHSQRVGFSHGKNRKCHETNTPRAITLETFIEVFIRELGTGISKVGPGGTPKTIADIHPLTHSIQNYQSTQMRARKGST